MCVHTHEARAKYLLTPVHAALIPDDVGLNRGLQLSDGGTHALRLVPCDEDGERACLGPHAAEQAEVAQQRTQGELTAQHSSRHLKSPRPGACVQCDTQWSHSVCCMNALR